MKYLYQKHLFKFLEGGTFSFDYLWGRAMMVPWTSGCCANCKPFPGWGRGWRGISTPLVFGRWRICGIKIRNGSTRPQIAGMAKGKIGASCMCFVVRCILPARSARNENSYNGGIGKITLLRQGYEDLFLRLHSSNLQL